MMQMFGNLWAKRNLYSIFSEHCTRPGLWGGGDR